MSKPVTLFAEISRLDDEKRIVEGYCYVNSRVKSDPWDLPVDVLRAASADYMRWANVREMHADKAVGTALDLNFQNDGKVFIRSEVVDDQAWEKVKKKVYKGFSIKGRPEVVRGNVVQKFLWLETSLVDRPADPEAVVTLWRRDGDLEAEPTREIVVRYSCLHHHEHETEDEAQACIDDHVARGDHPGSPSYTGNYVGAPGEPPTPAPSADQPAIEAEEIDEMTLEELTARLDAMNEALTTVISRLDAIPASESAGEEIMQRLDAATATLTETNEKLVRVETDLAQARAEIQRLGDQPAGQPVVRFTHPLTREVVQRFGEANVGTEMVKKLERFAELQRIAVPTDPREREKLAEETLDLQRELKAAALI